MRVQALDAAFHPRLDAGFLQLLADERLRSWPGTPRPPCAAPPPPRAPAGRRWDRRSGRPGPPVRRGSCPCRGGARWARRFPGSRARSPACRSGGRCCSVRMLCSRSASLMRTTRMSSTMASIILRTFSAWRSSRVCKIDLADLGDALDDVRHLVAEFLFDFLDRHRGVFDQVVQQAGGDGDGVQLHLRQHAGHFQRVHQVGLAGSPGLSGVISQGEVVGLLDEIEIVVGPVGPDLSSSGHGNA